MIQSHLNNWIYQLGTKHLTHGPLGDASHPGYTRDRVGKEVDYVTLPVPGLTGSCWGSGRKQRDSLWPWAVHVPCVSRDQEQSSSPVHGQGLHAHLRSLLSYRTSTTSKLGNSMWDHWSQRQAMVIDAWQTLEMGRSPHWSHVQRQPKADCSFTGNLNRWVACFWKDRYIQI
jgi:hypothetical protein